MFKRIYDKYYKNAKSHNNPDLLLLIANNSFEHAILILHSLLVSKDEKELKIEKVLSDVIVHDALNDNGTKLDGLRNAMLASYPEHASVTKQLIQNGFNGDDLQELRKMCRKIGPIKLKEIIDKFKNSGFHKIRHEKVAHKDKKHPDPAGLPRRVFNDQVVKSLEDIVKMLVVESYFWFDYVPYNSDLDRLLPQLDKIFSAFPKKIIGDLTESYSL